MNYRKKGSPRSSWSYRAAKRNYDKRSWGGVEPTRVQDHPPLIKIRSKRGEVSYRELWQD